MRKLYVGIFLVLVGVCAFVLGLYYGWLSGMSDIGRSAYAYYQQLSSIFGVGFYVLVGGGFLLIAYAIRKMNRDRTKSGTD